MKFCRSQLALAAIGLSLVGAAIAGLSAQEKPAPDEALKVGTLRVGKILFLGNSITLHGPAPKIGWDGNWGMAASAREKDYVHQLLARISKSAGKTPQTMVRNIADFERNLDEFDIRETLKQELAFAADVVILAIGENAAPLKTDEDRRRFSSAVGNLLTELKQQGQPTIFVRSQFWADEEKDRLLKQCGTEAGGHFVDISPLGRDPANFARAERQIEHEGVAGHPGDQGMAALAEQLWQALEAAGAARK